MKPLAGIFVAVAVPASVVFAATPLAATAAEWISVPGAPVYSGHVRDGSRAADGTSWFVRSFTNEADIVSAKWVVSGLGVFEVFANGQRVGEDFLKPGFTHWAKTKYSFPYDITDKLRLGKGETNVLAAEVSAGWWRDKIVTPATKENRGFLGKKSAFWGELALEFADGRKSLVATGDGNWRCAVAGRVKHAAIFDGEEYDARRIEPVFGEGLEETPEINNEFNGEILPSDGGEVVLREDSAIVRGPFSLKKGDTLVVDFAQNCAAVPKFTFRAPSGTVLTVLPAETLNDADAPKRGCDGPKGTVYRANLRIPDQGMRIKYTFAGNGSETYMPRFTFFGYRYLSLTATGDVQIDAIASIPVSSIRKEQETGSLATGDEALNRFISNVYWGQLSNYLSVPTDCPQRNERLGWAADSQVFAEAGAFNADTSSFLRKYMRDMRDSQSADGGFPSVAPFAQYGNEHFCFGWADAGVIIPWTAWRQFGDERIIRENWDAMASFVRRLDETKYDFEDRLGYIYADWLSYEKFESCGNSFGGWEKWKNDVDARNYRLFLAACYWLYDARLMEEMGRAIGKNDDAAWFGQSAARALSYIRTRFLEGDGMLLSPMRGLQTACVFAIHFGIVEGVAREKTKQTLLDSIRAHGDCLQTGFLGTSFILDALAECGAVDVAYTLLLQHKNPSWLYSVDQGATTVWERWNSYTKADGFGPVSMNSFNHYAYGAVLAWIYRTAAGIAPTSDNPGFRTVVMAPKPDRRLGWIKAEYKSANGVIKSAWRYDGDVWIWDFSVPDGMVADVTIPGDTNIVRYTSGDYSIRRNAAEYDVAAYVWPAYQPEPRWAELGIFGDGKGEWQNVYEAKPKWEGHRQPLVPLWGYENEADPKVVEKKIAAAVSHGVNVFIYDWYWYCGKPFLEDGLDKGFLGASNNEEMQFFIMWANHHVCKLWDNKAVDKQWDKPTWRAWVDADEFRKISRRWIEMYFSRPNYYRIGGKPVLMIYEIGTFIEGLGGLENAAKAMAEFRKECEAAGLGGVHLMACDCGIPKDAVAALGIDSASIYNFVHWASTDDAPDYAYWAEAGARRFDTAQRELGLKMYFAHASVGWDTNPRYPIYAKLSVAKDNTPANFEAALRRAKDWTDRNAKPGMPKLITVNSWNEWTEGSYLEPDTHYGFGYLEAIKKVFGTDKRKDTNQ